MSVDFVGFLISQLRATRHQSTQSVRSRTREIDQNLPLAEQPREAGTPSRKPVANTLFVIFRAELTRGGCGQKLGLFSHGVSSKRQSTGCPSLAAKCAVFERAVMEGRISRSTSDGYVSKGLLKAMYAGHRFLPKIKADRRTAQDPLQWRPNPVGSGLIDTRQRSWAGS